MIRNMAGLNDNQADANKPCNDQGGSGEPCNNLGDNNLLDNNQPNANKPCCLDLFERYDKTSTLLCT